MGRGRKGPVYTTHEEDKQLVVQAISGDQRAYNILLQKYKPILYIAAKRRLPNSPDEELEDIVMAVLGNTFVKIKQYDPDKAKFFWWIVASLHNHVSLLYKRNKLTNNENTVSIKDAGDFAIYDDDFTLNYDKEQVSKLIRLLITKLPEDLSKAITMRYFKDATNEEIALVINCKPSEVWYRLKRGRDLLKKLSYNGKLF